MQTFYIHFLYFRLFYLLNVCGLTFLRFNYFSYLLPQTFAVSFAVENLSADNTCHFPDQQMDDTYRLQVFLQ